MAAGESQDIELGHIRDGYPALANWIARDPDSETYVFRKFSRLGARNLLHLQSHLITLEYEIDQLDDEARRSDDYEARQSSRRWETLTKHAEDSKRPEKERLEKAKELEIKLKEYCKCHRLELYHVTDCTDEALLLQADICRLAAPSGRVLGAFRDYIDGKNSKGLRVPLLSGRAKDMLISEIDLVALRKAENGDILSRVLQDHWIFQKHKAVDPFDRTTIYSAQHVVWTVAAISTIFAAALLIGAIISLYAVTNPKAKLGMVGGYTVIFALGMAGMTNAKRAEIFGATAAYAAVLVVFVSGNLGGSGSQCLLQTADGVFKRVTCPE
jgi:hypothetical protein